MLSFLLCVLVCATACDEDRRSSASPTVLPGLATVRAGLDLSDDTAVAMVSEDTWVKVASMPTPRAEVATAVLREGIEVYVIGGFTGDGRNSAVVEVFRSLRNAWEAAPSLPEPLDHAMAAGVDRKVYVIGGWRVFGEQASDALYEYDPAAKRWASKASMPLPRAAGAAVAIGGTIYVVGGVGPEPEVGLAYDLETDAWRRIAPMADPREHLAAAVVEDRVYAIGGRWSDRGNVATVEEYDPASDSWIERASMPTARGGLAAAALGTAIHVVGGESFGAGSRTFEEHEVYEPGIDRWTTAPPLPRPRHGLGAQVVAGILFVLAGGETPGLSVSGHVDVFVPAESPFERSP